MRSVLLYLFFSGFVAISTSQKFRSDYNYHQTIQGWLKLHVIPVTFEEARQQCHQEGAVLVSPVNTEMQTALKLEMDNSTVDCAIYTGVHSIYSKGQFISLQGVPLAKMPVQWAHGEPDNAGNNENCIAYISNGTIADINCNETLPFVCYKKKGGKMNRLPCGTTDRGYQYYQKTESCYKFHETTRSWPEAFQVCTAEGGYLAIINSRDEADVLINLIAQYPNRKSGYTFCGFHDWEKNRVFRTVHDETLAEAGYAGWASNEPNNAGGTEYCGCLDANGALNDINCNDIVHFICEKDPNNLMDCLLI